MSERKTQYRIVPTANGQWGIQSQMEGSLGWNWIYEDTSDYGSRFILKFPTQIKAEKHIDGLIQEDKRKAKDAIHLKTPPRIYP